MQNHLRLVVDNSGGFEKITGGYLAPRHATQPDEQFKRRLGAAAPDTIDARAVSTAQLGHIRISQPLLLHILRKCHGEIV